MRRAYTVVRSWRGPAWPAACDGRQEHFEAWRWRQPGPHGQWGAIWRRSARAARKERPNRLRLRLCSTSVTTTTTTTTTERHSSSTLRFYGEFAACPCSHRPGLGAWPLPRLIPRCSGFACFVLRFCFKSARRASGDHVKPQFRMLATCCEALTEAQRRLT